MAIDNSVLIFIVVIFLNVSYFSNYFKIFYQSTESKVTLQHWNKISDNSDNILINGRGRMFNDTFHKNALYQQFREANINPFREQLLDNLPLATFFVTANKRYRFRLMCPGFTIAPIRMSIDNHTLSVIATDSGPVKRKDVKAIVIYPGERYIVTISKNGRAMFSFILTL